MAIAVLGDSAGFALDVLEFPAVRFPFAPAKARLLTKVQALPEVAVLSPVPSAAGPQPSLAERLSSSGRPVPPVPSSCLCGSRVSFSTFVVVCNVT